MKRFSLIALCMVNMIAHGMQPSTGTSDMQKGLEWLSKDISSESEWNYTVSHRWHKGMSFLRRYVEKNFNEADIYDNVIYFNECEYSIATYGMNYLQIKNFLQAIDEVARKRLGTFWSESDEITQVRAKYIQLIRRWENFDSENLAYRRAWETGDWKEIRKMVKAQ